MQNFDVHTWAPQSHDRNPMEHACVGTCETEINEYPTPTKGLCQLVQASFRSITPKQCQKLYHSMPNRIQTILASKIGVDEVVDL